MIANNQNNRIEEQSKNQNQEVPQRYKSYFQLFCMAFSYALGTFYFGYSMVYLSTFQFSFIAEVYGVDWHEDIAQGIMVSIVPIGAGVGCLCNQFIMARISRRQTLLLANAISLLMGGLVFIQNPFVLLFVRFFQGISVGIYSSSVPILIQQTAPIEVSGLLGALVQITISFGFFFAFFFKYILGQITKDSTGKQIWYYVFGFTLITVILQTILLLFVYPFETVKYLLENDRNDEARDLICLIYKEEYVDEVIEQKIRDFEEGNNNQQQKDPKQSQQKNAQSKAQNNEISQQAIIPLTERKSSHVEGKTHTIHHEHLEELKTPKVATFMGLHLFLLQQFSGVNAVVVYGGITSSEVFPDLAEIIPFVVNFQQFIVPVLFISWIQNLGRKTLLQWGVTVSGLSTGLIGVGFVLKDEAPEGNVGSYLVVAGMVIFMANFGISIGPVIWIYVAETVQPTVIPYATSVTWLGATIVTFLFPIIKGQLPNENPAALFLFFAVWAVISFIVNAKFAIEPKDKSEREIRDEYDAMFN